jgi:hypothetical protein
MRLRDALTGLAALVGGCATPPEWPNELDFSENPVCIQGKEESCMIRYILSPIRIEYNGVVYNPDTAEVVGDLTQSNIVTGESVTTVRYCADSNGEAHPFEIGWLGGRLYLIGLQDQHGMLTMMFNPDGTLFALVRPPGHAEHIRTVETDERPGQ